MSSANRPSGNLKLVPRSADDVEAGKAPQPSHANESKGVASTRIDVDTIRALRELESPYDEVPFLDELIQIFTIDSKVSMQNLLSAFAQKDAKGVNHWAHKLKGQARNLGARRVSAVCAEIESLTAGASLTLTGSEGVSETMILIAAKELENALKDLKTYLRSA